MTWNAKLSSVPIATSSVLGGVKVGTGLSVTSAGVLSIDTSVIASQSWADQFVSENIETAFEDLGSAAYKFYTTSVTSGSADLPTSGAVYSAIAAAVTSALHYRGMSSTALTDGGTETAIIGGVALVPQSGDVVIYNGFEFLWENSVWNKLGDDSSYALKTITVSGDGTYITGGGDLTAARTLTLSSAVLTSLGKADSAYQKPSGGIPATDLADAYLKLTGGTMANTNLVTNMNADLLDGLHSHEQRRFNNAQVPTGTRSFAAGFSSQASGDYSVALGYNSIASGQYGVTIGRSTYAVGTDSTAFGLYSYAGVRYNDSYVYLVLVTPAAITINGSTVYGGWIAPNSSTTFTYGGTNYSVTNSHATAYRPFMVVAKTSDLVPPSTNRPFQIGYAFISVEGRKVGHALSQITDLGDAYLLVSSSVYNPTVAERTTFGTTAAKALVWKTTTSGNYKGAYTFATNYNSMAVGDSSVAFNYQAVASGSGSFVFGNGAVASGGTALAFGAASGALASNSIALGNSSVASGLAAVTLGNFSVASGGYSLAAGDSSIASHQYSMVFAANGKSGASYQTVFGKNNAVTTDALVVGWGTAENARANIMTLSTAGALTLASDLTVGGNITLPNNTRLNFKDSNGTARAALYYTSGNELYIGSGTKDVAAGYTRIFGKGRISFNATSDSTAKWILLSDRTLSGVNTITPEDNNTGTLGTANNKFLAAYATTFYGALSGNASTATKLETARTLWGQSFDGTANVSGALTEVTDITGTGLITMPNGKFSSSFIIPHIAPSGTLETGEVYLWSDATGIYSEMPSGSGGDVGDIYPLTVVVNGVQTVYNPAEQRQTITLSIPTALYSLTDDATHRLVTDTQISTWNAKQAAISDLATIRSNANLGAAAYGWGDHRQSGYLTSYTETDPVFSASAAAGITSSNISTWNAKQDAISDLATIRSNASTAATAVDVQQGSCLTIVNGHLTVDTQELDYEMGFGAAAYKGVATSVASGNTNLVTSGAVYTAVNAKYTKPSTGIPKTDLASAVQTSLGKADTALQSVTFSDLTSHPTTLVGYGITDAYTKTEADTEYAKYLPLAGGTMTGNITFSSSSDKSIYANNGTLNQRMMLMSSSGNLTIGYDLPTNSKALYLDGYSIYLRYGTTKENSILMNGSNGTISGLKNMVSATTETYNLGNTGNRWLGIYANTVNAATGFTTAGTLSVTGVSTFTGNLVPNTTNATDIGSSSKKFKDLYLAGTATVNGITSSGNILPSSTGLALGSSSNKWAALWTDDLGVNGAVLTSLIPDDGVFDLGASGAEWGSLYVGSIFASNEIRLSANNGKVVVEGLGGLFHYNDDEGDDFGLVYLGRENGVEKIFVGNDDEYFDIVLDGHTYAFEADVANSLAIPKVAPSNPDANKAYLWVNPTGNYAQSLNS